MPDDDKPTLLDRLRKLLTPGKNPAPGPAPEPTPDDEEPVGYLRLLLLLRQIPFQKLGPVLVTVPVVVFLALSGAVAWLAVGLGLLVRIVRFVSGV